MPVVEKQPRPDKVAEVAEIKELLNASTVILTDFQGLNVKNLSGLRKKLRESNSGYRIVKNTLLRRAAQGTAAEPLATGLAGQTAVVYTDDPIAAAKTLQDFMKASKLKILKKGVLEGQVLNDSDIESLAKIPPREQLVAMVVGGLQGPLTGLVGTMQQMISQLVFTLQGVADKKAA